MKVTEHFKQAKGKTLVSFEILPPPKGSTIQAVFDVLDPLMELKPPFVDVTYHREEYVYKQMPSGYFEKVAIRKRPGTIGICSAISHRYGVDAVPHLLCGGFTKEETENALIDLHFLGIDNVLALRGDARAFETKFVPEENGHAYAIDLVRQITDMNNGKYLDEHVINGAKTDFCIGVAGYPEKHFESPNMRSDIINLKKKVDAGADYVVTQMFFDNQKYFDFVKMCRDAGIHVPIIPGLKPITKKYQLNSIPRRFFVDMPEDLVKAVLHAKTPEARVEAGIEWTVAQTQELKAAGVPAVHFYTMDDAKVIKEIVRRVF